ncbi:MAG: hypothetical protein ACXV8X_16380 [Candidatus Angelobacter sp.]
MSFSAMTVLNALEPICMLGGATVTLLSLPKPSNRNTYAAKLLSINSGISLLAAGILCSLIGSNDFGNRLFNGILVALMLMALALPEHARKENPVKPDSPPPAHPHVPQNNP